MLVRKLLLLLTLSLSFAAFSQTNFTYTPEKPKPGDLITITYEAAGALEGNLKPVEAVYSVMGSKHVINDFPLKRIGKKFTGTIQTDTSSNFIYLGFAIDGKYDNNNDLGYTIFLYENDQYKKGALISAAVFYQHYANNVGVERNYAKALEYLDKEKALYADQKNKHLAQYANALAAAKKEESPALILKEIEAFIKAGLKTEDDYVALEQAYRIARMPQQASLIVALKKEVFPDGKWKISDYLRSYSAESDFEKSKAMLAQLQKNVKENPDWSFLSSGMNYYEGIPYRLLKNKKDWTTLAKELENTSFSSAFTKTSTYNDIAWGMQEENKELQSAEKYSRYATEWARKEITAPTGERPDYLTEKQWAKSRKGTYAQYADTYGMVLYRLGEYKKGYALMKEVIAADERQNISYNNTYALLAEKALSPKQFQKEMEAFVEDGKASSEMVDALKRVYIKRNGSETGYEAYLANLKKASYIKMLAELKKKMISEESPAFALLDLEGKNVNFADLKGKVVVVDFWATWCGPCRASFPGMQKMVDKFKDDPNVKFVFIDTWENGDNKQKTVSDFIKENKYSFHVLMDNESKVVEQFKVEGIPTKFVIDKNGIIRFKSVGFDGSDEKLMTELTAMIELAAEASAKTF